MLLGFASSKVLLKSNVTKQRFIQWELYLLDALWPRVIARASPGSRAAAVVVAKKLMFAERQRVQVSCREK